MAQLARQFSPAMQIFITIHFFRNGHSTKHGLDPGLDPKLDSKLDPKLDSKNINFS